VRSMPAASPTTAQPMNVSAQPAHPMTRTTSGSGGLSPHALIFRPPSLRVLCRLVRVEPIARHAGRYLLGRVLHGLASRAPSRLLRFKCAHLNVHPEVATRALEVIDLDGARLLVPAQPVGLIVEQGSG